MKDSSELWGSVWTQVELEIIKSCHCHSKVLWRTKNWFSSDDIIQKKTFSVLSSWSLKVPIKILQSVSLDEILVPWRTLLFIWLNSFYKLSIFFTIFFVAATINKSLSPSKISFHFFLLRGTNKMAKDPSMEGSLRNLSMNGSSKDIIPKNLFYNLYFKEFVDILIFSFSLKAKGVRKPF